MAFRLTLGIAHLVFRLQENPPQKNSTHKFRTVFGGRWGVEGIVLAQLGHSRSIRMGITQVTRHSEFMKVDWGATGERYHHEAIATRGERASTEILYPINLNLIA